MQWSGKHGVFIVFLLLVERLCRLVLVLTQEATIAADPTLAVRQSLSCNTRVIPHLLLALLLATNIALEQFEQVIVRQVPRIIVFIVLLHIHHGLLQGLLPRCLSHGVVLLLVVTVQRVVKVLVVGVAVPLRGAAARNIRSRVILPVAQLL